VSYSHPGGKGRAKSKKRGGERVADRRGRQGRGGEFKKNTSKMQHIWHYGDARGSTAYSFRKFFSPATFPSQTVCVYLEPFKS